MPEFDDELTPGGWFDPELEPEGWFSSESSGGGGGGGFPGDVELKIRLGSTTVIPMLWPHLVDRLTVDDFTNVASFKAYLEGQDGTRVLLNDNQPGVAKYKPSGQTTEYAGSWAQDFGANGVVDEGIDHAPTTGGISGGNMASAELATAFQMLADRTATFLVLVMTPADPSADVSVSKVFVEYTKSSQRKIFWENAHQAAIIHPSGPGVRFAGFNTGSSGTINNPPSLYDGFGRPNSVDWLIWERLLVRGVAHDDGLTTELTTRYDSYEGNSVGQVRGSSHGFLLPVTNSDWNIALVNSLSEVPPLAGFPRRRRSSSTWLETGVDFVQHSYAGMQSPDYFVNPSQGVELRTDDDTTVWTSSGSGVTGWAVTQHEGPVANNETDFGVWLGDRFAEIRPFRGHYSVVPPLANGSGLTYCSLPDLGHCVAFTNDSGKIVTISLDNALNEVEAVQSFDGTRPHLSAMKDGRGGIRLCYEDGGNLYTRTSYDGLTWSTATTALAGDYMVIVAMEDRGYIRYYLDGTDIKGQEYDNGDNLIGSAFTAVTGVDADSAFDADESNPGQSSWRMLIWCYIGGVRTLKVSTDGRVFV